MIFTICFHLSLKCLYFEAMPSFTLIFEYILCDLFARIHHYFSTGTEAIVWCTLTEVALKDTDEKTITAHTKPKHKNLQTYSTALGSNCNPIWCEWQHCVSLELHALQIKWKKSKWDIFKWQFTHTHMHTHCSRFVWNHPNSVSILLCLNGAIFFKQYLASPHCKRFNLVVNMIVFSMCDTV